MLELFSTGIHAGEQRRDRKQKKFCGNKTSTGCKTRRNLTIHFHQGSVGTLGVVGSTHLVLLEIYSGVITVPKIIEIGLHLTKLLQKPKGCRFFETQCIISV